MKAYDEAQIKDVLGPVMELVLKKEIWLSEEDWKLHYGTQLLVPSPWFTARFCPTRDCVRAMLYFNHYGVVTKECRSCWKVIAKLKTLKQLMQMKELQLKLDLPGKCGYEDEGDRWLSREGGLYTAFWYVPIGEGLEGALELRKMLTRQVRGVFGDEVELKVKRACTEMERSFGDTKLWDKEVAEKLAWDFKEELLDAVYVHENEVGKSEERLAWEHKLVWEFKLKQWVHFAARQGDMTYLEFKEKRFGDKLSTYSKEDLDGKDSVSAKGNAEGSSDYEGKEAGKEENAEGGRLGGKACEGITLI